jgi:tRNA U34 5-methylaminomethyl-2-thiouridine-forming methyltransferase MnmC
MRSTSGYQIVKLVNGAYSVHSLAYRETCHPVIGPAAEAEALFVRQLDLCERLRRHQGEFVIWDVGLGAAANPLTVLRATREIPSVIHLVSFDSTIEPLHFALSHAGELGYFDDCLEYVRHLVPHQRVAFTRGAQTVDWQVHLANFPVLLTQPIARDFPKPHLILFDPYSPAHNSEMWTQPLFTNLFQLLDPARPCALPTYSRSTMLRVTLLLAGFFVGTGHPTGRKEETTMAANCRDFIARPLDRAWLQRARTSTSAEPLREPVYRQAPLSAATWERLQRHPQFAGAR